MVGPVVVSGHAKNDKHQPLIHMMPHFTMSSNDTQSSVIPTQITPLLQSQTQTQFQSQSQSQIQYLSTSQTHIRTLHTPDGGPDRSLSPSSNASSLRRLFRRRLPSPPIHLFPAFLTLCILGFVLFAAWDVSRIGNCRFRPLCEALGAKSERLEDVWLRNSGPYAPFRSRGDGGGHTGLPRGCEVDQVTILHRHAARFPTSGAAVEMQKALGKLAGRRIIEPRRHPELLFLNDADFHMKDWEFNQLTEQGRHAAWSSGREMAALYKKVNEKPFVRSAGGGRVVETASYWLQGFNGLPFKRQDPALLPQADLVFPECTECNSTLSVHTCPAFENAIPTPGSIQRASLLPLLNRTASRLNPILQPSPLLDTSDITHLADMCGFDSQAKGKDWKGWSRWCNIFNREEWEVLGYIKDVERWYMTGEGGKYGATLGAGYINELIARFNDSVPHDETTTNRTVNVDPTLFPRGGKRIFVDFTHDNEMIEILTSLGIEKQHRLLPIHAVPPKRTFILSDIIPFGARFIFERVACDLGDLEPDPNEGSGGTGGGSRRVDGKKDYVRILIKISAIRNRASRLEHLLQGSNTLTFPTVEANVEMTLR